MKAALTTQSATSSITRAESWIYIHRKKKVGKFLYGTVGCLIKLTRNSAFSALAIFHLSSSVNVVAVQSARTGPFSLSMRSVDLSNIKLAVQSPRCAMRSTPANTRHATLAVRHRLGKSALLLRMPQIRSASRTPTAKSSTPRRGIWTL